MIRGKSLKVLVLTAVILPAGSVVANAQVVLTLADGVIENSLCVGFDCGTGISFSDTTILLRENNTRIKFDDTSVAASFPNNDWELEANSNVNGGPNQFALNDCGNSSQGGCASDPVLVVEAGVRSHALHIDSSGDVGFGTATPATELHTVAGDTPTLRLDQNGSSGFAPQTWDVAGNETSFFIRDATNGSTLPFRIRPGAATNSLVIDADDDVGVGILSPDASLHVRRSDGSAQVHVEETSGTIATRALLSLENNGGAGFSLVNSNSAQEWRLDTGGADLNITLVGTGELLQLDTSGNLTLNGNCADAPGGGGCTADYVFEPEYPLMPLADLREFIAERQHLPNVPSAEETRREGLNVNRMHGRLLEKVEELVLYTLSQQEEIDGQRAEIDRQRADIAALRAEIAALGVDSEGGGGVER